MFPILSASDKTYMLAKAPVGGLPHTFRTQKHRQIHTPTAGGTAKAAQPNQRAQMLYEYHIAGRMSMVLNTFNVSNISVLHPPPFPPCINNDAMAGFDDGMEVIKPVEEMVDGFSHFLAT